MALTPGTRLGPYDIAAQIGVGGMGEVYRAHDRKLDRAVAIKILPDSFAADADRLMRFEREARTLASLNHPHIAAIYGLEDRALVVLANVASFSRKAQVLLYLRAINGALTMHTIHPANVCRIDLKEEDTMKRYITTNSAIILACGWTLLGPVPTQAAVDNIEPVIWSNSQKSSSWAEELLGQVATYQTLAEKSLIPGNFEAYVEQMRKVRELYRTGNRRATYDGVNQLMVMLEARVGGIDAHSADALWDFCYRVTPDEYQRKSWRHWQKVPSGPRSPRGPASPAAHDGR